MDVKTALFFVFAAVLLFAAFRVITARNPVHAALYLVLAFFQASMVWMLLQAEFLAITLVLVYVGAVMVLFLFVVMMLDINLDSIRKGFWRHFPFAAIVGGLVAAEMAAVLTGGFVDTAAPAMVQASNTKALGVLLYTEYLFPLEVAAVLLLVAIVAAIALTLRERKESKAIDPGEAVRARKADRVQLVRMPASVMAVPEPAVDEEQKGAAT